MGAIIAVVSKKGENATDAAVSMLSILAYGNMDSLGTASATTVSIGKNIATLQTRARSPVIVGHVFSQIFPQDKPQPIKLENAALVFEGRIYSNKEGVSDAEVAAKKLAQKEPVEKLIKDFEGGYAFAVAEPEKIVAGRDVAGIYPFYYGESRNFAALASERKALWSIGIKTVNSFPPGHLALIDRNDFRFKSAKTLIHSKAKQTTTEASAKRLQKLLQHSVKKRVYGLKEVAVTFSGGLDSSLIAFLAKKLGVNVHLIHASLENQPETQYAQKAAEELKLPIYTYLFREKDVETVIPKVLWLIEETDPVKVGVGIPFYWAAEKAVEMNLKVLLAGQGADELFGGYKRYVNEYLCYDDEKARRIICNDILKMHETNFERDFKICNFHNAELRLPFATLQIAKFAIELPIELKMERKENGLRKLVLRKVARNLGLPQFIVERPKKAVQYATGVNKVLKKLAIQKGLSVKEYLQKTFQQFSKHFSGS